MVAVAAAPPPGTPHLIILMALAVWHVAKTVDWKKVWKESSEQSE